MKAVGYPLSVSRLSKTQLHALQGPMVSLTLNRMHFPKRTARVLVYGPRAFGGLEFGSLESAQGAGKIILLLRHLRIPGQPHDLTLIVLDRLQYTAGVGFNILMDTTTPLPHLEGVWLPTARDYLGSISGTMQVANMNIQSLERHGDRYIMDIVLASGAFQAREVKFVNYCRLYLRVLTVSDLCNATGDELAEGIHQGYRHHSQSYSLLADPHQVRPSEHVWGLLFVPLGPWFARMSSRRGWPNLYLPFADRLFCMKDGKHRAHKLLRTRVFHHDSFDDSDSPTGYGWPVPIDVCVMTDGLRISHYKMEPYLPADTVTPSLTFEEHLQALPSHEAVLLQHFELLAGNVHEINTLIADMSKVFLVSDGGAAEDYGSFGWVLGLEDGTRLAQGWGKVFGHDPKSYRAEAYGAKAGSLFLWNILSFCKSPLPETSFNFFCDNEGLIKKLMVFRSYANAFQATCLHSEWDIVSSVHSIHEQFRWMPSLSHVPSHQDDHHSLQDLDLPTRMNIEADTLATRALQDGRSQPVVPFDPACGAMLSICGKAVTRNIEATVQRAQHTGPIRDYLCKRFTWDQVTFESIDWAVHTAVYSKIPRTRTFFCKLGWKQLPIGARLHKWSPSYDHRCPSCDQEHEDDDHVYRCAHMLRAQWRTDLFRALQDKFGSFLDPDLLAIIRIGLTSFFADSSVDFTERFPADSQDHPYTRLITQQGLIGWDHFIRGKISKEWGARQYAYARRYNLLDESKQWQTALVRFLAHSSQRLWQIRNGCRHGIDAATQTQLAQEQIHREVRCLYHLRGVVLTQDRHLFRDTVELHLTESIAQLRTWLTHNAKLISHSAKLATAQAALRIRQLKAFFPPQRTIRSIINVVGPITTRRRQTTRLNSYFATTGVNKSTTGRNHRPSKNKQYTTPSMATYYTVDGISRSVLPPIDEDAPSISTSPQRRQIRRRGKTIEGLFPDHPG
jgi:hypothetical protein